MSKRRKKKTPKEKFLTRLKDPCISYATLNVALHQYIEDLDTENPVSSINRVSKTMRFRRYEG